MERHPIYGSALNPPGNNKPPTEAQQLMKKRAKPYGWLNFVGDLARMGVFTENGKSAIYCAMNANFWSALVLVGQKQATE